MKIYKINTEGKLLDMSIHEYHVFKNVKEMIDKLERNPEFLAEFNRQIRGKKLEKIISQLK